ncbi:MAG: transposase [Promethearchaeota archaeon]
MDLKKKIKLNKKKYLSIDFGLNNLITAVENKNSAPFIISGRILKSINHHWNKRKARLHSIKDKQEIQWTEQLDSITIARNDKIHDFMHKTARFIVEYCVNNEIGTICLGDLKNIKKNIRMGRQNNQNFVNIPHSEA